ncbi:unnamed protein product [Cyprideis torosa]|uniref:Uncharacterized protein n=1 Tax=Cyprideis torosa TaxID=163714 RepID=A0A7R8WDK8_9CRUS|nr:unnamed protein product [Cyprideis torosa]CAG0894749.1 unnamed protein product [Cyprideis torosa]
MHLSSVLVLWAAMLAVTLGMPSDLQKKDTGLEKQKPLSPKELAEQKEQQKELQENPEVEPEVAPEVEPGEPLIELVEEVEPDDMGFGPVLPAVEGTRDTRPRTDKSLKSYNQMLWSEVFMVLKSWAGLLGEVFDNQMRSSRALGMPDAVGTLTALAAVGSTLTVGLGTFLQEVGLKNFVKFVSREVDQISRTLVDEAQRIQDGPYILDRALDEMKIPQGVCRKRAVCELEELAGKNPFGKMALKYVNPWIPGLLEEYEREVDVAIGDDDGAEKRACHEVYSECSMSLIQMLHPQDIMSVAGGQFSGFSGISYGNVQEEEGESSEEDDEADEAEE